MNDLMIFEGHQVEAFELNGEVLFNPYHVGDCLELTNSAVRKAIGNMTEKQVVKLKNSDVKESDIRELNNAGENFLTESGVYKLVFKSHKPNAEKFTDWITDEVLPTLRKTGSYEMPHKEKQNKDEKLRIMEMNARSRMAQTYLKMAQVKTLSPTYQNILVSKASEILAGEQIIPLPKIVKKTYSATEIGDMFGISANKIGRIANANNLKTGEYREYIRDKSRNSPKEVDTWVYFDTAIPVFEKIINREVR